MLLLVILGFVWNFWSPESFIDIDFFPQYFHFEIEETEHFISH